MKNILEQIEVNEETVLEEWRARYKNELNPELQEKYKYDYQLVKKQLLEEEINYEDPSVAESIERINGYMKESAERSVDRLDEFKKEFEEAKENADSTLSSIKQSQSKLGYIVLVGLFVSLIYVFIKST